MDGDIGGTISQIRALCSPSVLGWGTSVLFGDGMVTFVLGWGIQGAAIATILGQFVGFLICVTYLKKSRVFRVKPADFVPSWQYLKPVLPLGAGSFLTQLCIVATTIANNILLKSYGARSEYGPDIPLSVLRDVLLIVLAIVMPTQMGIMGILWSAPVADMIAMAITAAVVLQVWRKMGVDSQPAAERTVLQKSRPGVIITIAREHGTAGKRVGQLMAEKLGIPCYYKHSYRT